jgi:Putative peptidoglycan binding domain
LKKRVWIEILTALFAGTLLFAAATTTTPAASKKKVTKKSSTSKPNSTAQKTKRRKKPAVASWRATQKAPSPERYKEIQQALAGKGYLQPEASSGVWDNSSVSALKKFQEDQSLEPSGKLDSLSIIALGLGPKH